MGGSGGLPARAYPAHRLYLFIGRFIVDMILRARMEYARTTKRALIVRNGNLERARAFPLSLSSQVTYTANRTGAGTIFFGAPLGLNSSGAQQVTATGAVHNFMFEKIKNVRSVFDQVQSVQNRNS